MHFHPLYCFHWLKMLFGAALTEHAPFCQESFCLILTFSEGALEQPILLSC